MKRGVKKLLLWGVPVVLVVLVMAGFVMFWMMGQPLYEFGSVRTATNLRSPLAPPNQTDEAVWRVEPDIELAFDAHGEGRPAIVVHGGPGIPYAEAWKGLEP